MPKRLLTSKQMVEAYPCITMSRLRWWIRTGQVPFIKMGRLIMFDIEEFEAHLKTFEYKPNKFKRFDAIPKS